LQPLKITIPGKYWDSHIYKGRLYLFGIDGDVLTIDWDKLIREWNVGEKSRLAMLCAFCQSDYLYGNQWSLFFSDSDVRSLIQAKFERLRVQDLNVSREKLTRFKVGRQDNPLPFPHTDATIYNETFYAAGVSGLFHAKCNKRTKHPISTRVEKQWDCPIAAVSASYSTLALAAGDEGLFEIPANSDTWTVNRSDPEQLHDKNCIDCSWAFYSIYGSSHLSGGGLASFTKTTQDDTFKREFTGLVTDHDIFSETGYSWGHQDKLCLAKSGSIQVVKYQPWAQDKLTAIGSIDIDLWKGEPVSGRVALFGTIVEYENALVIVPSGQGPIVTLRGEPVNWRVFPRSKQYENQLHVIYTDYLEILSFNHDYFLDQADKISGITYLKPSRDNGRFA